MDAANKSIPDPSTQKNIDQWLNGRYDKETQAYIRETLRNNPKQIIDAFFSRLAFGTAGLRGIMGIGTNRMNVYNVRATTQGLADYINRQPKKTGTKPAVFIGYDSRLHSREFAEETAKVLAGNDIIAYLCKNIRPTPYVSFGCRFKHCISAIMITASHNPAEYNGYKVYWSDGGQIVPPHDAGIIAEVAKITDPGMVKTVSSLANPLVIETEHDVDDAYIQAVHTLQNYPEINQKEGGKLKIVYTSLHGTGITLMPRILSDWGFTDLAFVEAQIIPDGTFPTVKSPNPEEHAALKMGIELLEKNNRDIVIANDPDADRVGVAVKHQGEVVLLTGNQIAAICLEHICKALSTQNRLSPRAAFVKSIVTTELFQAICDAYQRPCTNVLTGFKYIAEKIREWEAIPEGPRFIFGAEESYGYLPGTYARDKDAISTSALICEVALHAKLEGKTIVDKLYELYDKHGIFFEKVFSAVFKDTKEGKEHMGSSMARLRQTPPQEINGVPVVMIEDYTTLTKYDLLSGAKDPIQLPASDILIFWLQDKTKIIVRPSGTEPKIKIYCSLHERTFPSLAKGLSFCAERCEKLAQTLLQIIY